MKGQDKNNRILDIYMRMCDGKILNKAEEALRVLFSVILKIYGNFSRREEYPACLSAIYFMTGLAMGFG